MLPRASLAKATVATGALSATYEVALGVFPVMLIAPKPPRVELIPSPPNAKLLRMNELPVKPETLNNNLA